MIAVIPAAGKGTRMKEHSNDVPKSLIQIQGKPFLYFLLNNLKQAGITEVILIVGHMKEKMEEFAKQYTEFNIRTIDQFEVIGTEEYGTLCPIKCVRDIKEPFLCVYGDNLYSINDVKNLINSDDSNYVAGYEVDDPNRYGVLVHENNVLKEIVEKPDYFVSNTINTGLYKFNKNIFLNIDDIEPSKRGEYELTDAINILCKIEEVKVFNLKDYWIDFGKPEDIAKVSHFLSKNQ